MSSVNRSVRADGLLSSCPKNSYPKSCLRDRTGRQDVRRRRRPVMMGGSANRPAEPRIPHPSTEVATSPFALNRFFVPCGACTRRQRMCLGRPLFNQGWISARF